MKNTIAIIVGIVLFVTGLLLIHQSGTDDIRTQSEAADLLIITAR